MNQQSERSLSVQNIEEKLETWMRSGGEGVLRHATLEV
jgi:hypothetical protein